MITKARDWVLSRQLDRAVVRGEVARSAGRSRPWIVWTIFWGSRFAIFVFGRMPIQRVCAICGEKDLIILRVPRMVDPAGVDYDRCPEMITDYHLHRHAGEHSRPRNWDTAIDVDVIPRVDPTGMFGRRVIDRLVEHGVL